ncbi:MAG: hypothetical protein ACP5JG_10920, partial [Anaerolineae bacterium]
MKATPYRLGLPLVLFVTMACGLPWLVAQPTVAPRSARPTATSSPTLRAEPTLAPTFTATPEATPTPEAVLDPQLDREGIDLFPWPLYAGDHLSVDVDPIFPDGVSDGFADEATTVTLQLEAGGVFTSPVGAMGLDGEPQARFYWIADLPLTSQSAVMTVTLNLSDEITDTNPSNNAVVVAVPGGRHHPRPDPAAAAGLSRGAAATRLHGA